MSEPQHADLHAALSALTAWHSAKFNPDDPDRQARARLRRVGSVLDVQSDAGLVYFKLKREVDKAAGDGLWTPRTWLPFIASLLPYLKTMCSDSDRQPTDCWEAHKADDATFIRCRFTLGKQLGKRDQRRVSSSGVDSRFRRLIAHEDLDDDFRLALARSLRLVNGEVCLWCLARDLRQWRPPTNPNKLYTHPRQMWAADYYPTLLKDTPANS